MLFEDFKKTLTEAIWLCSRFFFNKEHHVHSLAKYCLAHPVNQSCLHKVAIIMYERFEMLSNLLSFSPILKPLISFFISNLVAAYCLITRISSQAASTSSASFEDVKVFTKHS